MIKINFYLMFSYKTKINLKTMVFLVFILVNMSDTLKLIKKN